MRKYFYFMNKLPDKFYRCGLDNIYMAAKFSNLTLKRKISVHRVTCKDGRIIPSSVLQEEVKSLQDTIEFCGDLK